MSSPHFNPACLVRDPQALAIRDIEAAAPELAFFVRRSTRRRPRVARSRRELRLLDTLDRLVTARGAAPLRTRDVDLTPDAAAMSGDRPARESEARSVLFLLRAVLIAGSAG